MQECGFLVHICRGYMRCYLCLGSNLGNTEEILAKAIAAICEHPKITLAAKSGIYKTEPQGDKNQEWFANQVLAIEYACAQPLEYAADLLMSYLLGVEAGMGRSRDETRRFGPRVIDIDIILLENFRISTSLVEVPHKRAQERAFVLIPLQEIAPHISIQNMPIDEALSRLEYRLDGNKIYQ